MMKKVEVSLGKKQMWGSQAMSGPMILHQSCKDRGPNRGGNQAIDHGCKKEGANTGGMG